MLIPEYGDYVIASLLAAHFTKKNFWWQNGVDADIHAKYVPICVVNSIRVDAKSENVPMTQK